MDYKGVVEQTQELLRRDSEDIDEETFEDLSYELEYRKNQFNEIIIGNRRKFFGICLLKYAKHDQPPKPKLIKKTTEANS